MSVDILPAKLTGSPAFVNPHLVPMRETRPASVDLGRGRRDSKGSNFDPNNIIYDSNTDTTYLRGKLLGKVNIQKSIIYKHVFIFTGLKSFRQGVRLEKHEKRNKT